MLNTCMFPEQKTTVLLETMAGKGTEVGRTFEELAAIIDKAVMNDKIGVCLDTCHVFDGGYDIVHQLDDVLMTFDKVIGLDRLKASTSTTAKMNWPAIKTATRKSVKAISALPPLTPSSITRPCGPAVLFRNAE